MIIFNCNRSIKMNFIVFTSFWRTIIEYYGWREKSDRNIRKNTHSQRAHTFINSNLVCYHSLCIRAHTREETMSWFDYIWVTSNVFAHLNSNALAWTLSHSLERVQSSSFEQKCPKLPILVISTWVYLARSPRRTARNTCLNAFLFIQFCGSDFYSLYMQI